MPISAPSWTEFLTCPICTNGFEINFRTPITLACGHTFCKNCLATLHRKQCPFDQTNITKDVDNLPINYALLQLVPSTTSNNIIEYEILPSIKQTLTSQELQYYKSATRCIEELAVYLKPSGNVSALLSRPMQRKLVTLINCQLIEDEGRLKSLRAARSLGERTVTELILQHQNPQLLSTHLWAAVRARGCQFLGPAMQEEVLKLVLLALEDGSALSRKVLVMYVVSKLVETFPQASKTSIGHVVQLLYRASCFKVSKRESDSSLMTLKEEFRTYEALRREHDAQIVQIATEAGLRIAPDQWSALLYGDNNHKSHMQSIIDKQQNPSSFALSVHELLLALQRTGDPANLSRLRTHMDNLANIDSTMEPSIIPTWLECVNALDSVKQVVNGLIDFIQHHGNRKTQENSYLQNTSRYKVSFCRELQNHGNCVRGQNCNFAHSDEELERYRAKYKKSTMRNSTVSSHNNNNNNHMKESNNYNASNGPNQKVNMNHHSTFAKNTNTININNNNNNNNQDSNMRFNKSMSYRSEHSLHPSTTVATAPKYDNSYNHNNNNNNNNNSHHQHHLKPTNAYSSSSSTPNLSLPLSPNQHKQIHSLNGPRFPFGNTSSSMYNSPNANNKYPSNNYIDSSNQHMRVGPGKFHNHGPPIQQNYAKSHDYKKQLSPYHHHQGQNNSRTATTSFSSPTHNNQLGTSKNSPNGYNTSSNSNNSPVSYGMQQRQTPPSRFFGNHATSYNSSSTDECNTSSSSSASFGDQSKYLSWTRDGENKQQKSPNNLMPKTPASQQQFHKPTNTSPPNRYDVSPNHDFNKQQQQRNVGNMNIAQADFMYQQQQQQQQSNANSGDEIDGMNNMWNYPHFNQQQRQIPNQTINKQAPFPAGNNSNVLNKEKFIRSDSILTSNTDDSYDNLPANGKFGAIGLKINNDMSANQWSGLQQTVSAANLDNNYDLASGNGDSLMEMNNISRAIENSIRVSRYNGNFLDIGDINIPESSTNKTYNYWNDSMKKWNELDSEKKSIDTDSLGSDMLNLKVMEIIDEN